MITFVTGLILFGFGSCLGSFASALQYRVKTGKGQMLTGRSACPGCDRILLWYHMIPIISWLALGGKCGFCHKRIGFKYVFLEMVYGASFATLGLLLLQSEYYSPLVFGVILMVAFTVLFLAVYDFLYQEVPDSVVVSMTLIFGGYLLADVWFPSLYVHARPVFESTIVESAIAACLLYAFFAAQNTMAAILYFSKNKQLSRLPGFLVGFAILPFWWTTKTIVGEKKADVLFPSLDDYEDVPSWVGGGDFRYAILLGLVSGLYVGFASLMVGYIIGGICGVFILARGQRDTYVPLIPFLASGWFVAMILITLK